MRSKRLYEALGVPADATSDQIKKAFRKLAREVHPDRNPDDPKAEARFKQINQAYEVLSDDQRRKDYDTFGDAMLEPGFNADAARAWGSGGFGAGGPGGFPGFGGGRPGGEGFSFDDLLGGFFGGRQRPTTRASVQVGFLQAAQGGLTELSFSDGRVIKARIPAGIEDGESLRLSGQGPVDRHTGQPGDLLLQVHVGNHPVFRREKLDLHVQVPITVGEALRGAQVEVPSLDGQVRVRVPAGARSGQRLRVRGKGIQRKSSTVGDLIAELQVVLPPRLSEEILTAIEAAYPQAVRDELLRRAAAT